MSYPYNFDLIKYLGTWYELAHYPSWFQRNDNYNTKAVYALNGDGTIMVRNSSITAGKYFESIGKAKNLGGTDFRVDFPIPEVAKLISSSEFIAPTFEYNKNEPNYVIDRIWTNIYGEYVFAVVTDPSRKTLYVLSRYKNPSLVAYNDVMKYVVENYDRDLLVQTPHFN